MPSLSEPCFVALEILELSETQTVMVFSGNLLETLFPAEPKPHSCIPPHTTSPAPVTALTFNALQPRLSRASGRQGTKDACPGIKGTFREGSPGL